MADPEPKELPPIVLIPEAQFIAKHLKPAFEEIKATLALDVKTLDKAQTKTMLDAAVAREGEEIKDDQWTPFYEVMHELTEEEKKEQERLLKEEGKEPPPIDKAGPLTFEKAKEAVLRYAVEIRRIPTRLNTALEDYSDEFTMPERQVYDFFKNESLTDVTLVHPTTGALYKAHRVILASGSRYMLEVFTKHSVKELPKVRVPEPFNQKNELHSDDQVSRILKYLYGNQSIGLIRDEINDENFYSLYA